MADLVTSRLRNVVLVAHGGAGKTSLADAMFFASGQISRLGRVDDRTSASDYEPEEQRRRGSIQLAVLPCPWKDHKINLIDTPGFADFRGEMISGLRVADAAILVIAAPSGIEVGSDQAWAACEERKLPRLIVINKLDRENTDFARVADRISARWGRHCVPIQVPVGAEASFNAVVDLLSATGFQDEAAAARDRLIEAIAETDDKLADKYLEGGEFTPEELTRAMQAAVGRGALVPVLAASALNSAGISQLLDAVVGLFPAPQEKTEGVPPGAQANLVFKTTADPFVGKLSYFRVYGTPVKSNSEFWNPKRNQAERIGQAFLPKGKEQAPTAEIITGDIGVIAKLTVTQTGDTLSDRAKASTLAGLEMPEPVYTLAVNPKTQADLDRMGEALNRMVEEDPSLRVDREPDTHETLVRGLGDVHVETALERLQRKLGVQLVTSTPKIPYRETVGSTTKAEYKHKKQTGGHGQYGHVVMEVFPRARGEGYLFESRVSGGNVPKDYIPAVEKGVRKAMEEGVLAGFPLVDVGVALLDGSSHPVDSSGASFEIAGSMALKKAVNDARPTLLEPIMHVTVMTPDDLAGSVMSDLNTRRAQILGMTPRGDGTTLIEAAVPQAMLLRYATELRSITQSRAMFTAKFLHYAEVPRNETDKVVAKLKQAAGVA
ncbi:MAG: elongation factor G [Chloroflexi bacterium]|nr:elongation factor G [Chloroflexota bacterium]